ncbi:iron complex transport system substrate-binding protein [Pseudomonas duriflava]|uniref:Iron complex transport system substrate-binding protein n=1 Tax=Pseudomonas duriflava TaxID=459528 RepID=A0A562QFN2_9PSED|nr:iron-siderophore ABC transporter substrate-binding protein [Pseudomonas duriflava]TWI55558.1 iron complex transport system substrate-binding protein [Pseudomonas duriflava]
MALATFNFPRTWLRAFMLFTSVVASVPSASWAQTAEARAVETAFGTVTVTGTPSRVVVLSENALDTALSAGVKPLGTVSTRGSTGVSRYVQDKVGTIAIVGTARETNLESVFKLQPDLILAAPDLPKAQYEKLSLLAPTIVPSTAVTDDWRKSVSLYAEALGRQEEIKASYQQLDQRIAALKARIAPGQVASVLRWNPQGPILMSSHLFAGQLLQQLGFKSPALAESLTQRPHSDILSLENLHQADGDWLFLATLNPEGEQALAQARNQPAFARLNAVKNNKVITVDGQLWSSGAGPLAAQKILDDVEKVVAH